MSITRAMKYVLGEYENNSLVDSLKYGFDAIFKLERFLHYAHWNIVGKGFVSLHSFFQEEYTSYLDSLDVIAEHIRQNEQFLEPIDITSLKVTGDSKTLLKNLKELLENSSNVWKEIDKKASQEKEPKTIDLCGEILRKLSKTTWKVDSIMKK